MTLPLDTLNKILADHFVANGTELDTDVPAILLPDQFKLAKTEHLQAQRARFRGNLETESLSDFCHYVIGGAAELKDQGITPRAFINAPQMSCKAFLNIGNHGTPGHGDHTAALHLKATAAFLAMQRIASGTLSQRELAEWMEDWHDHLSITDTNGSSMTVAEAVQKVRNITIKASAERTSSETNFSASQSAMDQIAAAHEEKQPSDLIFSTVPYEELKVREFTLRLSILTGESKPQLRLRWVQKEAQEEEIAQEFKELLTSKLGNSCQVTVGRFTLGE